MLNFLELYFVTSAVLPVGCFGCNTFMLLARIPPTSILHSFYNNKIMSKLPCPSILTAILDFSKGKTKGLLSLIQDSVGQKGRLDLSSFPSQIIATPPHLWWNSVYTQRWGQNRHDYLFDSYNLLV